MYHYYHVMNPKKRKTTHLLPETQERAALSATISALLVSAGRATLPAGYRPRIGLPADLIWDQRKWPFVGAHAACVLAIEQAGGEVCPFHVRVLGSQEDPFLVLWRAIRQCDGLCLSGSWGDIDPRLYGESPHPQTELPEAWLHWWMLHLALFATILRVPFLGICGGMHAWNVALGGRLLQDLRGRVHVRHLARRATPEHWALHPITVLPHTMLSTYLPNEGPVLSVPSAHNQAVDILTNTHSRSYSTPGLSGADLDLPRLQICARSPDELVAAVESAPSVREERFSSDFALGFQDHLEWSTESWAATIFRRFVQAAQDYAVRKAGTPSEQWEALTLSLRPALERVQRLLALRATGHPQGGAYAAAFH
jgi:gamma-glutamyl-gamma-aminobutyrate hydrolase PuuD